MLKMIYYGMGILLGIGLWTKLISTLTVRRMVKEAAEIHKSEHRFMKLLKAKFEHMYMVSERVQNVGAFVDKYLYEYKVCGIRLQSWRNAPKKSIFLILILGAAAVCESIRADGMTGRVMEYIQWTGIFVLPLLLVQLLSGEKTRLLAARNYMVEYLENVCIHRYEKKHQEVEEPQNVDEKCEEEEKSQQEIRIRAILEEFLA